MLAGALLAVSGTVRAEGRAPEPSLPEPDLICTLIALEEEIRKDVISVALVLEGEIRCEGGFTCTRAARVLVILPAKGKGGIVRREIQEKILLWSEEWGWFSYRELSLRGGEAIRIFSEKRGIVEIR